MYQLRPKPLDFKSIILIGGSILAIYGAEFLPRWSKHPAPPPSVYQSHRSCSINDPVSMTPQICKASDLDDDPNLTRK